MNGSTAAFTAILAVGMIASAPAAAQWRLDQGVAIVSPSQTNSNAELLTVACGDPFQVEIYANGGPIRPDGRDVPADYFYKPGKVRAVVDGRAYPLVAAGSDMAVVLFGEGTAAEPMADMDPAFIRALETGTGLEIGFDVVEGEAGPDGSPFETFIRFSLEGSSEALGAALATCRS